MISSIICTSLPLATWSLAYLASRCMPARSSRATSIQLFHCFSRLPSPSCSVRIPSSFSAMEPDGSARGSTFVGSPSARTKGRSWRSSTSTPSYFSRAASPALSVAKAVLRAMAASSSSRVKDLSKESPSSPRVHRVGRSGSFATSSLTTKALSGIPTSRSSAASLGLTISLISPSLTLLNSSLCTYGSSSARTLTGIAQCLPAGHDALEPGQLLVQARVRQGQEMLRLRQHDLHLLVGAAPKLADDEVDVPVLDLRVIRHFVEPLAPEGPPGVVRCRGDAQAPSVGLPGTQPRPRPMAAAQHHSGGGVLVVGEGLLRAALHATRSPRPHQLGAPGLRGAVHRVLILRLTHQCSLVSFSKVRSTLRSSGVAWSTPST